jgi:hypothetical protein
MNIEIKIPKRYSNTNINEIKNMLNLATGKDLTFSLFFVERNGRYIEFNYLNKSYFILFSAEKADARNSYIMQYIPLLISEYIKNSEAIYCVYYLRNNSPKLKAKYHIFTNRLIKTLNFKVLNEFDVMENKSEKFSTLKEMISEKDSLRSINTANKSSYFYIEDGVIHLYAKLFGANVQEAIVLASCVRSLEKKLTFKIYPVYDNNSDSLSETNSLILTSQNMQIDNFIHEIESKPTKEKLEIEIRDQVAFKKNLLFKFGDKRCYLCNCTIESAIVASHIERVSDIKKSSLDFNEKVNNVIDGDNGLWLCRLHDIFFENGLIYFKNRSLEISSSLSVEERKFVEKSLSVIEIDILHFNSKMESYLSKHLERIGIR